MNFLYRLPLTVSPGSDDGELKSGVGIEDVTPGLLGFLATLFMVLVVFLLIRDMVKRIRRVRYREQARTGLGTDVFIPGAEENTASGTGRGAAKNPRDGQSADGDDSVPGYYKRG